MIMMEDMSVRLGILFLYPSLAALMRGAVGKAPPQIVQSKILVSFPRKRESS